MEKVSEIEYFIGGAADKNDFMAKYIAGPTNVIQRVESYRNNLYSKITTKYRGHENEDTIVTEIEAEIAKNKSIKINITGHSWGGGAAIDIAHKLAKKSIQINELITLDPVSILPKFTVTNANIWVNVYQEQSLIDVAAIVPLAGNIVAGLLSVLATPFSSNVDLDDTIATLGGQLGSESGAINKPVALHHMDALGMYKIARTEIAAQTTKASGTAGN